MDLQQLLRFAVENNASDIHIQAGMPPRVRIGGVIRTVNLPVVTDEIARKFIASIAPMRMSEHVDEQIIRGMDFSYSLPGLARFRCSAYQNLNNAGIAMRIVRGRIPTLAELNMPAVIGEIALSRRGLTLVTGTTGSGKSTTLAAMIELINNNYDVKVITVEDPIEYLYTDKRALISQFEVGTDSVSFDQALRQALRQDPDVILVGE